MQIEALVTDVHLPSALAGMRDLGRAGVGVLAVGHGRLAAGLWSRHADVRRRAVSPVSDPATFASAVASLSAAYGPMVVYPGCEASVGALLGAAPLGGQVVLPYPAAPCVEALRDKSRLPGLAGAAGLRAPETLIETRVAELLAADLHFPYVVKPIQPGPPFRGGRVIERRADLLGLVEEFGPGEAILAQEYVSGPQVSVAVVIDRAGRVIERFQHRVLRMSPPEGGGTTLAISVAPSDELVSAVGRMLSGAGYWGLAQLDIVLGPGGPPSVADVNPRYYNSLPLASACGVNLPEAWHRVATASQGSPAVSDYRLGVTFRSWAADVHVKPGRLWPLRGRRAGPLWDTRDPIASVLLSAQAVESRLSALAARLRRDALAMTHSRTRPSAG